MKRLAIASLACWTACAPTHRLTPRAPLAAIGDDGVTARVVALDLYEASGTEPADVGTAFVEIENHGPAAVAIDKERLRWVGLLQAPEPRDGGSLGLGGAVGTGLGGASGSSSGSFGSSGSGVGGGIGLGLGIIAVGIVLIPIGIGVLIYRAVTAPPHRVAPGESARFRIPVTLPIASRAQHIALGSALGGRALDVPVVDPTRPHGGWGPPRRLDHLGFRIGGGPIAGDGRYSGIGGVQFVTGRRVGPLSVGAGAVLLGVSVSVGPELAVPIQLAGDVVEIAPTIDFQAGGTLLGRTYFLGPTAGVELAFPIQRWDLLGWDSAGMRVGLYGKAGPTWTDEGRYYRWEVGVVFR